MNRMKRTLPYLRLVRAPAVFTAVSNIAAAQLIVSQGDVQWIKLGLLIGASCAIYMAGMVLNDCFDFNEDARERPWRPLPSGAVPIALAWWLGGLLLVIGVALTAWVSFQALLIAVLLAATVALYDGFGKTTLAAAPLMGLCRYLNWILGLSTAPITMFSLLLPLPILVYVTSLTLLSGVETTARSRWPLYLCGVGVTLTAVLLVMLNRIGLLPQAWALALALPGVLFILYRLTDAYQDFSPARIQRGVAMLIFGIIPLDAIMVFAGGPEWGGVVILMLLIPSRLLGRLIYVT